MWEVTKKRKNGVTELLKLIMTGSIVSDQFFACEGFGMLSIDLLYRIQSLGTQKTSNDWTLKSLRSAKWLNLIESSGLD